LALSFTLPLDHFFFLLENVSEIRVFDAGNPQEKKRV
jgi:hypothetical protein